MLQWKAWILMALYLDLGLEKKFPKIFPEDFSWRCFLKIFSQFSKLNLVKCFCNSSHLDLWFVLLPGQAFQNVKRTHKLKYGGGYISFLKIDYKLKILWINCYFAAIFYHWGLKGCFFIGERWWSLISNTKNNRCLKCPASLVKFMI